MQLQVTVKHLELTESGGEIYARIVYFDPFNEINFTVEGHFDKRSEIPELGDKFTITFARATPLVQLRPPPTPMPSDGV